MAKSRILVVGGTGYIGKRIVKASLAQGHTTYVLLRPENGGDIDKIQMLLSFKEEGAELVEASFSDHQCLVDAVKLVDVVVCAMSGSFRRGHNILMQLKLVDAIKEAGNIKRFLPSEFATDPKHMGHALEPGRVTFDEKMIVRRAIEEAKIPHTYVCGCLFAGYFVGNLAQFGHPLLPPKQKVQIFGDGNIKVPFMDEDDIGTYTIKTVDDPRTLNKTLYLQAPENILTQTDLIEKWENLKGEKLEKSSIAAEDFLALKKDLDYAVQGALVHYYHTFYEGSLMNFEIGEDGEEISKLYPEVQYTRIEAYLKRYL